MTAITLADGRALVLRGDWPIHLHDGAQSRRNDDKLGAAVAYLGQRWVLHPVNHVPRVAPRHGPTVHPLARRRA